MKTYGLYLESGPMKRKTMVHVPALTGCIARGATTDEALANTPDAIRAFLAWLSRHGEPAEAEAPFRTKVSEHVTEGVWLGQGVAFFTADLKPITAADIGRMLRRIGWLHDDIKLLLAKAPVRTRAAAPAAGRPLDRIVAHIAGAEGAYIGGVSGVSRLQRELDEGRADPMEALDRVYGMEASRLRALTAAERALVRQRGQSQWSARYALRRMVEHAWEHYVEIAERLGATR